MSLADRNLHKRIRYEVRKTLASVRASVESAIAKLTYYEAAGGGQDRSDVHIPTPDIFREVDDAWAELNKLHADLDEGKIRLG